MMFSVRTSPLAYPPGATDRLEYEQTVYDAWYRQGRVARPFFYQQRNEQAFVRSLLSKYRVPEGASIIDIGCGNGYYASRFASNGLKVTAVDLSATAIEHAKLEYGEQVKWIAGDAFALPFDREFEYGFCHFFTFFNAADVPAQFADYGQAMMKVPCGPVAPSSSSGTAI